MDTIHVGSNAALENGTVNLTAKKNTTAGNGSNGNAPLASDASWSATWKGSGTVKLNINCPIIHPTSNVMLSISEFNNTANPAGSRFIGSARYTVCNISPREGGVVVWVEISWASPINIFFGLLVS